MELVYRERKTEELRNCVLVTGSEAVSRYEVTFETWGLLNYEV